MPGADVLGGILASAGGELAGGAAANAIMGDTSYPDGGGIPGITNTDTGKSGVPSVTQVTPGPALKYYQQAADAYAGNAKLGLQYYNQALTAAQGQLAGGYAQANETLKPMSQAGTAAMDQYMKMLGLDTPSPTQYTASNLKALGGDYSSLTDAITSAEKIQDPTARAAAKASIMDQFGTAMTNQANTVAANKQAALAAVNQPMTEAQARWQAGLWAGDPAKYHQEMIDAGVNSDVNNSANPNYLTSARAAAYKSGDPNSEQNANTYLLMNNSLTKYNQDIANINNQYTTAGDATYQGLKNVSSQYNSDYSATNADYFGYHGNEMNEQLANTPGYQFSLDQGNSTIERSLAAKGMFNSGNTLKAMDDYSQGLAQQTYNQYMSNLLGVAGIGNAATGQISTNQANQGIGASNLTMQGGNAALNTYTGIGNAYNQAYNNQGNAYTQIQLANMQAQNNAILGAANNAASAGNAAMGAGVGLAGIGNQQAQQQQYAQGFNSGGGGGGSTYYRGGMPFTNYSV